MFPTSRSRRLRQNPTIRQMIRENSLSTDDLIYPIFVCEGENVKNPIGSMPGISLMSSLAFASRGMIVLGPSPV